MVACLVSRALLQNTGGHDDLTIRWYPLNSVAGADYSRGLDCVLPKSHCLLQTTNRLEPINKEMGYSTRVVGKMGTKRIRQSSFDLHQLVRLHLVRNACFHGSKLTGCTKDEQPPPGPAPRMSGISELSRAAGWCRSLHSIGGGRLWL